MTETITSDDTFRTNPPWSRFFTTPPRRSLSVVLVLAIALVSFILGVNTGDREVQGSQKTIQKLQNSNQALTADNKNLQAKLIELQANLTSTQAKLNATMPSPNIYEINPNQSRIVPYGHLTIGLVGTPSNDKVDLNVNGKQYSAAAGGIINVPIEQSVTCRLEIMSFEVLKSQAEVNAICVEVKQ